LIVQHVLVPIDFSATPDRALAYAIALAQQLQARLTLLHVLDMTPVTMGDMTAGMTATCLDGLETDAGVRSDYHGDAWADGTRPRVFGQCGRTRGPTGTVSRAGGPQSP